MWNESYLGPEHEQLRLSPACLKFISSRTYEVQNVVADLPMPSNEWFVFSLQIVGSVTEICFRLDKHRNLSVLRREIIRLTCRGPTSRNPNKNPFAIVPAVSRSSDLARGHTVLRES